jgi:hypothetical protein
MKPASAPLGAARHATDLERQATHAVLRACFKNVAQTSCLPVWAASGRLNTGEYAPRTVRLEARVTFSKHALKRRWDRLQASHGRRSRSVWSAAHSAAFIVFFQHLLSSSLGSPERSASESGGMRRTPNASRPWYQEGIRESSPAECVCSLSHRLLSKRRKALILLFAVNLEWLPPQ